MAINEKNEQYPHAPTVLIEKLIQIQ